MTGTETSKTDKTCVLCFKNLHLNSIWIKGKSCCFVRYLDKGGTLIVAGGNLGQICYVPCAYTTLHGNYIRDSWQTKRQYCKNTYNCNINWSTDNTKLCGWGLPAARHEFCFHSQISIMNFTVICLNLHNWRSRRLFFFV
jgi:hypothetical protein